LRIAGQRRGGISKKLDESGRGEVGVYRKYDSGDARSMPGDVVGFLETFGFEGEYPPEV
jgi:hypothetical protein